MGAAMSWRGQKEGGIGQVLQSLQFPCQPFQGWPRGMCLQAEEAYNRRSMLQRIMLGGEHRIQAVSFFQEALLHRLPTASLRSAACPHDRMHGMHASADCEVLQQIQKKLK